MRPREKIDWGKIDWSKSNREISREQGISLNHVSARRGQYAPAEHRNLRSRVDWQKIDWSMTDQQIALQAGVTQQTVYARRRKKNAKHDTQ